MGLFGNRNKDDEEDEEDEDDEEDEEEVTEPDTVCNLQINWDEDTKTFGCALCGEFSTYCDGKEKCPFWNGHIKIPK